MALALDDGFADAACADDNNATVLSAMRTDASRMRIGCIDRSLEGVLVAFERGEYRRLTCARQRKAGHNGVVFRSAARIPETAGRSGKHLRQALFQAEAHICRTTQPSAKRRAFEITQPRPAACTAAIDSEKKRLCVHLEALIPLLI